MSNYSDSQFDFSDPNSSWKMTFDRIPEKETSGGEAGEPIAQHHERSLGLVLRLIGRIDQHQAAAFNRRELRLHRDGGIESGDGHPPVTAE